MSERDDFNVWRGLAYAVAISLPLWALVAGAVWWLLRGAR